MGYNYGYSPIPESPWASFGNALGYLGQSALQWMPAIWQNLQLRERMARGNLQTWINDPNLSQEQKQAAVDQYMQGTAHLPAWMRLQWPKQIVPGPVTTAAQPAVPSIPAETISVPRGLARSGMTAEEQSPTVMTPEIAGHPAIAEVRGPATSQWYVPPTDPMLMRISALPQAQQDAIRHSIESFNPSLWPFIQGMSLREATQVPGIGPMIGMSLAYGGFGGGTTAGTAVGAATGGQVGGAQPGTAAQSPVFIRPGMTWGQAFPMLGQMATRSQNPEVANAIQQMAAQPIPFGYWDPQRGFRYPEAQQALTQSLRDQGLLPPTQAETLRLQGEAENRLRAQMQSLVTSAKGVATGPGGQQRAHGLLQRAHALLAAARNDPRYQGVNFDALESEIPNSQDLARAAAMSAEETSAVELVRQKARELGNLAAGLAWVQKNDPVAFALYQKATRVPSVRVNVGGVTAPPGTPPQGTPGLQIVRNPKTGADRYYWNGIETSRAEVINNVATLEPGPQQNAYFDQLGVPATRRAAIIRNAKTGAPEAAWTTAVQELTAANRANLAQGLNSTQVLNAIQKLYVAGLQAGKSPTQVAEWLAQNFPNLSKPPRVGQAPTSRASGILKAWNDTHKPIPRSQWALLTQAERDYLSKAGIQVGP